MTSNFLGISPGLSTWDPRLISASHTIPILQGIRKWEWYGSSMGIFGSHVPTGVPGISLELWHDSLVTQILESSLPIHKIFKHRVPSGESPMIRKCSRCTILQGSLYNTKPNKASSIHEITQLYRLIEFVDNCNMENLYNDPCLILTVCTLQ